MRVDTSARKVTVDRPAPPTPKGQRRRGELLKAAQEVFEKEGYFETRVADIVKHAHVSTGTFYAYFDSKDDILRTLIDTMIESLYSASVVDTSTERTPYESLEATIRQFMLAYKDHAKMMRILEQVVTFDDNFRAIRHEVITRFNERIRLGIVALQERGEGDPDLDPRHASFVLGGMVGDCAFACYVLEQNLDEDIAVVTMARIWAKAIGVPIAPRRSKRKPTPAA